MHGYALLQSIADDQVRLDFAGESLRLGKTQLATFWNGEFIAVWRLPEQVPATLHIGDAGAGRRLGQGAARAHGRRQGRRCRPGVFRCRLEERIRKLQIAYGIKPDGIVGPETLFALSALDENGPHLGHSVE